VSSAAKEAINESTWNESPIKENGGLLIKNTSSLDFVAWRGESA
jgi:hypothetical protein